MTGSSLWIDGADWATDARFLDQTDEIKGQLEAFIRDGYVIIPNAVPTETCDRILADSQRLYSQPEKFVMQGHGGYQNPAEVEALERFQRVLDLYAVSNAAREAMLAPKVSAFLHAIFDAPPLAMQSLFFEYGSQQGVHQDTAYVVVDKPLSLAASWLALEDVTKGSGELIYYAGSHRFDPFMFSGEHKHWLPPRDGNEQHDTFLKNLHTQAEQRDMQLERFLARKGDVLIWHADLAHGGAKIETDRTRRSLVAHYCPQNAEPHYQQFIPDPPYRLPHERGAFSSWHYDLRPIEGEGEGVIRFDGGITQPPKETQETTAPDAPIDAPNGFLSRLKRKLGF